MKRDINTRQAGVTADIVHEEGVEQTFTFDTLGVSVQAKSMSEALIKAKEIIKERDADNQ